jgi:hypothetical protein
MGRRAAVVNFVKEFPLVKGDKGGFLSVKYSAKVLLAANVLESP